MSIRWWGPPLTAALIRPAALGTAVSENPPAPARRSNSGQSVSCRNTGANEQQSGRLVGRVLEEFPKVGVGLVLREAGPELDLNERAFGVPLVEAYEVNPRRLPFGLDLNLGRHPRDLADVHAARSYRVPQGVPRRIRRIRP